MSVPCQLMWWLRGKQDVGPTAACSKVLSCLYPWEQGPATPPRNRKVSRTQTDRIAGWDLLCMCLAWVPILEPQTISRSYQE